MDRELYFDRYPVSTWLYVERRLEEALIRIAGAGFKKVEIWADLVHLDPRANPDIRSIRELLARLNLQVHSVHLPHSEMNLGYPDWSLLNDWLDLSGKTLEYCAQLDSRIAVVHPGGPVDEELSEESARVSTAFVNELEVIAGRLGIRLAVENMISSDRRRFGCSLIELAAAFPGENFGFCLDTGHAALNRSDIIAEVQAGGRRLLSIHADNNDGLSDLHQIPTDGVIDWSQVEASLVAAGFEGCRVLEVSSKGKDPDAVLLQLQNLWQAI